MEQVELRELAIADIQKKVCPLTKSPKFYVQALMEAVRFAAASARPLIPCACELLGSVIHHLAHHST